MKPCRECGKEVSTEATKCPHCGVPDPTKQSQKVGRGCGIGCLSIVAILLLLVLLVPDSKESTTHALSPEDSAHVAAFGPKPQQSPWDGSYPVVERYLKSIANDPESIEFEGCTDVRRAADGWQVGCEYFGANAFGAKVRASSWFTIAHGQVVSTKEAPGFRTE